MKARLLIVVLTCAIMLAILATVGGVTKAHADATGNETCGGSASGTAPIWTNGTWFFDAKWTCGTDKIFSMEIQHTTNGGATVTDWGTEHSHRSPAGCGSGCGPTLFSWSGTCSSISSYRDVAWVNGGHWYGAWLGAGKVC